MASSRINGVLMTVLRGALTLPDRQIGTDLPADYVERLPFVWARETPGGSTHLLGARFQVPVQVDVFSAPEDSQATCEAVIDALAGAWRTQQVNRFANVVGPWRFTEPGRADGVARWVITATLTVRQPAAL